VETDSSEDQEVLPLESLSIDDATVATIANKIYTGNAIKPAPVVTLDGVTLVAGTDYTVSYANNIKVGTATITITGTGSYSGSLTATFTIVKASISKAGVAAIGKRAYTGKAQQPAPKVTFGDKTLKKDTDYTLSYKNNTKAGKATCTIKGKGNFTGQKTVAFQIVNPGIAYCTHVQKVGWQSWRRNGSMSGTSGRSLRLEAIQIKLYGEMANKYDVYYRVHAQHMGWMTWAKNGANSGTAGFGWRLEGIQVVLVRKGAKAPGRTYAGISSQARYPFIDRTGHTYKTLKQLGLDFDDEINAKVDAECDLIAAYSAKLGYDLFSTKLEKYYIALCVLRYESSHFKYEGDMSRKFSHVPALLDYGRGNCWAFSEYTTCVARKFGLTQTWNSKAGVHYGTVGYLHMTSISHFDGMWWDLDGNRAVNGDYYPVRISESCARYMLGQRSSYTHVYEPNPYDPYYDPSDPFSYPVW